MTFLTALLMGLALAQDPRPAVRKAMQPALDKQKESVRRQLKLPKQGEEPAGEQNWFTNPWPMDPIEPMGPPPPQPVASCGPFPSGDINSMIKAASAREGVREDLIRAVIEKESAYQPCAVSPKGALGLMQLMPAVARELGVIDPFSPLENINGGVRLLKQLLSKYAGNVDLALSAYNAGSARVDKDGGIPAIAETQDYVSSIRRKLPE